MSQLTKFEKARFRNFQSFGNNWTEIDLTLRGTTLIVGENLDDGGSSGAGKTTALAVISYCLYDKIPSGVSKDKMINATNGKKNTSMEAEFFFSKGGNNYKIYRARGAATGVHLYENDKDITPASVSEVNAKIEELVGFSYNLFCLILLFSGNGRLFLDMSVGEQRLLMEELYKITRLTRKANALKKISTETNKEIARLEVLIEQQKKHNDGFRSRLALAKARVEKWDEERGIALHTLQLKLDDINAFDFDAEETFHNEINRLEQLKATVNSELTVLNGAYTQKLREKVEGQSDLQLLQQELSIVKRSKPDSSKVREIERLIDEGKKVLTKLDNELHHLQDSKCPYCLQDFQAAKEKIGAINAEMFELSVHIGELAVQLDRAKMSVEEENQQLEATASAIEAKIAAKTAEVEAEIAKQAGEVKELKDAVDLKKVELSAVVEEQSSIKAVITYKSLNEAITAKQSVTMIETQLEAIALEVNPHLDAVDTLEAEGEVKIDQDALDELIKRSDHQKFLLKLLTDKNSYVRKNLIATTTPFLNKRIGYYLERLNLPHVVLFQADMSCEITQLGRSLDHGNLSNGEKKRLNLALCLSFRDVLTYLHSKVNVLFTDEVDGGSLDSNCVDLLISLLKKKAWDDDISIFVISHRPEFEGRCDRTFIVRKEQGFSSLIIQPDS